MATANVHRFTADEFLSIDLPRRVELIDGVICDMSPETPQHAETQASVLRGLMAALADWLVVAGGSVRVTDSFCPIPDAVVYRPGTAGDESYYQGRDAALIVEVGVTTAWSDRAVKLSAYAAGEIEEVWLVVPGADLLTCYRRPENGRYLDVDELAWPEDLAQAVDQLAARLGP